MSAPLDGGEIGFDVQPTDSVLTPDEELAAALQADAPPVFATPSTSSPQPLGRGWPFDFQTGQFVRRGQAPAEVRGLDELRVWVEKCLRTARFAHPIYGSQYGLDPVEAIGQAAGNASEIVGHYAEGVTDALLVHDRITDVQNFRFTANSSSELLEVSFDVLVDQQGVTLTFQNIPLGA